MKKKFTTTLDEELIKEIKLIAIKENTTVNDILEKLIIDYIEKVPSNQK